MAASAALLFGIGALIRGRPEPGLGREFLGIGVVATVATLLIPFARRYLDERSVVSLGLRFDGFAVKDLVFGWLLSGLMAGTFFLILLAMGRLTVTGYGWSVAWVLPLLAYFVLDVIVGWWEELFFRGYLFDNMVAGMGVSLAILVSCVLYGLVHALNPNAGVLSSCIIVVFGFLRLFGLLTTKQLWLSMGMHMGWNFFQGAVFGFAASGRATFRLIEHTTSGPAWLTGGNFGPEGSVLMLPILGVTLIVMWWWATRILPRR